MELLRNRGFALLVAVVVAVSALIIGTNRTSDRYASKIEESFYSGVYINAENYTQRSIDSHLNNCADAALGLATMMGAYPELADKADELLTARRELLAAESIKQKGLAGKLTRDRFSQLLDAATSAGLSKRDVDAATEFFSTFSGALTAISGSRYNDKVNEYFDGQSLIARTIGKLANAKQPEAFIEIPFFEHPAWPW